MLLETGEYRYDRNDHHGPTLYYLTLPVAWIRDQTTLAELDERTIRAVPAIFGAGLILLFPLLAGGLGRTSVAVSAFLAALSPALTYYSRSYIQESIFVCFTLAFLIALGRYALQARAVWAICAGTCAGLAYATKETSLIVLLTAAAAAAVARVWTGAAGERDGRAAAVSRWTRGGHAMAGLAAALMVSLVFYSSFFAHPEGLVESIRAFSIYVERGVGSGPHAQPWDYYLRLLAYTASAESSGPRAWSWRWRWWACSPRPVDRRHVSGLATSVSTPCSPAWRFPASATRRRGTCCRSTPLSCCWPATAPRRW
jgi:uncharacterized protein (TIGR03663 family)